MLDVTKHIFHYLILAFEFFLLSCMILVDYSLEFKTRIKYYRTEQNNFQIVQIQYWDEVIGALGLMVLIHQIAM